MSIGKNLDQKKKKAKERKKEKTLEEWLAVSPPESVSLRLLVTPSYENKALKKTEREIHQYVTLEENTAMQTVETSGRVKLQDVLKAACNIIS